MDITVKLSIEECDALRASAISMHTALKKDKHVAPETIEFWYALQDKLMMAKIHQTK
jgi:hypothetical protein